MADREKVIQGLEVCLQDDGCSPCPYFRRGNDYFCGVTDIMRDALELLKEQEAVEPKTGHWIYKKYDDMFMCSCCEKYSVRNNYPYCHWCGAKMEQEGR